MQTIELLIDLEASKDSSQDSLTVLAELTGEDGCLEIAVKQVLGGQADDGNNGWQDATPEQIEQLLGIARDWVAKGEFFLGEELDSVFLGNVSPKDRPKNVTILI